MQETSENCLYNLPLAVLNMRITHTEKGLMPLKMLYGTQCKTSVRGRDS